MGSDNDCTFETNGQDVPFDADSSDGQAIMGLSPTIKLLSGDVRPGEETVDHEIEHQTHQPQGSWSPIWGRNQSHALR